MFGKMDHTAWLVKDAEASAAFYCRFFGFKPELVIDNPSPRTAKIIFLVLGDARLELLQQDEQLPISGAHIAITSTDLLADFAVLQEAGVRVRLAPVQRSTGGYRAVLLGPDMEEIEIIG